MASISCNPPCGNAIVALPSPTLRASEASVFIGRTMRLPVATASTKPSARAVSAPSHEPSGSRRAPQHDLARHREADRPVAAERRTLKRGERIPSFHRETAKPALLRALTLGAECRRRRLSGRTRRHTGDKVALAVDEARDPALR